MLRRAELRCTAGYPEVFTEDLVFDRVKRAWIYYYSLEDISLSSRLFCNKDWHPIGENHLPNNRVERLAGLRDKNRVYESFVSILFLCSLTVCNGLLEEFGEVFQHERLGNEEVILSDGFESSLLHLAG